MSEIPGSQYDEDYFIRGEETGKSLYSDYRWLPNLTIPMCQVIAEHCGFVRGEKILDFGCARGYSVRALRALGYDAWGCDISRWAVANADPSIRKYIRLSGSIDRCPVVGFDHNFDWIVAKDVLEHVPHVSGVIDILMATANKGLFVVVPLTKFDGSGHKYVVEEYEKDITHTQRLSLTGWVSMFLRPGWKVEASYRVKGVKDNYARWEIGNGFLTVRRLLED